MSEIVFNPSRSTLSLQTQIDSLQTTLASLNQQVIFLQEALQEKDQKIAELETQLSTPNPIVLGSQDNTLTIIGALINLYKFAFPSQSDVAGKSDFPPGKEVNSY